MMLFGYSRVTRLGAVALVWWLVWWLGCGPAQASQGAGWPRSLQLCISDIDYPPFTYPAREGVAQRWIRHAVEAGGGRVAFVARPWRRCLVETAEGRFDGVVGAAASVENLRHLVFPGGAQRVDTSLAIGTTQILAYRPRGSRARWDGQRFHGLQGPVLFTAGISALRDALKRQGVPYNDAAPSPEAVARMLLHGRSNLALDHDLRVRALLKRREFMGRLEILPRPYASAPVYLAINPRFYIEHAEQVAALWQTVAELSSREVSPRMGSLY